VTVASKSFTSEDEVAEHIVKHLLTQYERSMDEFGGCIYQYEDVDGKVYACAIGCLIDRDYYDESLENKGVEDYDVLETIQMSHPDLKITSDLVRYMHTMQMIHDNLEPERWVDLFIDKKTGDMVVPKVSEHESLLESCNKMLFINEDQ
jgi:hypothetical protein